MAFSYRRGGGVGSVIDHVTAATLLLPTDTTKNVRCYLINARCIDAGPRPLGYLSIWENSRLK